MFSRLSQKDTMPHPIDSLIADAQLKLHGTEFGSDEYDEITHTIFKLQRMKESRKATSDRKRLELAAEIVSLLSTLLFFVKPELAAKYSRVYLSWQLSKLFGHWS